MEDDSAPTPGLKWRPRQRGKVPYWLPRADAVKAGYPKTAISLEAFAHNPALMSAKCCALQSRMLNWLQGIRPDPSAFDGTIGAALRIYETHEESPYHKLKPGSLEPYKHYLSKLPEHIGRVRVDEATALDAQRWIRVWSQNGIHPAAGRMSLAVLKAALTFCIVAGHRQCRPLRDDINELRVPSIAPRKAYATAGQVTAARAAAHKLGRPSGALCYAFQYETVLRLWDVAGQWFPLDAPLISSVVDGNRKWVGLEWRHIDANLILRYKPSKTDKSTGAEVLIDLKLCPMVLEEIAAIPPERRVGPIVVYELHRRPYTRHESRVLWKRVRKEAGLPEQLWCRDLRASAITEARANGGSNDDASKVAGHAKPRITSQVYDRASLEAHQRFAAGRLANRSGNVSGNDGNDAQ